jgi:hypothetical protein
MNYKPRTSREINQHRIEMLLKSVKKGNRSKEEAAQELNERFERLQGENIGMYEELHPKYIKLYKTL